MGVTIACLLTPLLAGVADGGSRVDAWVGPVPLDEIKAQGPVTPKAVAAALNARLADFRGCYDAALVKQPQLTGKIWLEWTIDPDGAVRTEGREDAPLAQCFGDRLAALRFPAPGAPTTVVHPFVVSPVGNWLTDEVVRQARTSVEKIDAAADGGTPVQGCRLYLQTGGVGGRVFVEAQRLDHPGRSRLVLKLTTSGMTDDVASGSTHTDYRDGAGRLIFRYRESSQTQGMAPTRTEERIYFRGSQAHLVNHREGPTADRVWFSEETWCDPLHVGTSVDEVWSAFAGSDGSRCGELRAAFDASPAKLKKRFGALVVPGDPPAVIW